MRGPSFVRYSHESWRTKNRVLTKKSFESQTASQSNERCSISLETCGLMRCQWNFLDHPKVSSSIIPLKITKRIQKIWDIGRYQKPRLRPQGLKVKVEQSQRRAAVPALASATPRERSDRPPRLPRSSRVGRRSGVHVEAVGGGLFLDLFLLLLLVEMYQVKIKVIQSWNSYIWEKQKAWLRHDFHPYLYLYLKFCCSYWYTHQYTHPISWHFLTKNEGSSWSTSRCNRVRSLGDHKGWPWWWMLVLQLDLSAEVCWFWVAGTERCLSRSAMERDLSLDQAGNNGFFFPLDFVTWRHVTSWKKTPWKSDWKNCSSVLFLGRSLCETILARAQSSRGIWLSNMAPVESIESRDDLIETILFVDVDGVLNVGIYDPFDAPILLKSSELSLAREIVNMDYCGFDSATAYKICALAATPTDESGTTFESLASHDQLSKVLVGRLSELIQDAGPNCHVVLSSSWRKRQHMKRRLKLEQDLSEALGRYFEFDAFTQLSPELHAGDRLEVIRRGKGERGGMFCFLRF